MTAEPDGKRAQVLQGLAALAACLKVHPELPLNGPSVPHHVYVHDGNDAENRAEVDRIATVLGVTARDAYGDGVKYEAVRDFGGGVTYRCIAMSRKYGAGHSAAMSYLGHVQPESPVAA
jgi:hypothetical protein